MNIMSNKINIRLKIALTFITLLGVILSILLVEILFHFVIGRDFVYHIKSTLSVQTEPISYENIHMYCDKLLKYAYAAISLSGIMCLFVSLAISISLSHKITNPLDKLIDMVSNLNNKIYKKIDDDFPYEIDILKNSFNQLVSKLDEQEELKKFMILSVSHELKTPLTTLQCYLEGKLDGVLELDNDSINTMLQEIDRLKGLVESMEDSAFDYKDNLNIQRIDVTDFIFLINTTFQNRCLSNGINLKIKNHNLQEFYADKEKITQVINNLIENAIKYSKEAPCINITFFRENNYNCISIADNGMGISKEDLPYIFERFYRGEKSRSRKTGGLGIGLAIVKIILDAHDGLIDAKSKLSEGSQFTIKIPVSLKN